MILREKNTKPIKHIVLYGNDIILWYAALYFENFTSHFSQITVIESDHKSELHGAESTLPNFLVGMKTLKVLEGQLLHFSKGTFKLAQKFQAWRKNQEQDKFWLPFCPNLNNLSFYHGAWLQEQIEYKKNSDFSDKLWTLKAIKENASPKNLDHLPYAGMLPYAYHIDYQGLERLIKILCSQRNVRFKKANIRDVFLEKGKLISLKTEEDEEFSGDFFVDCSHDLSLFKQAGFYQNHQNLDSKLKDKKALHFQLPLSKEAKKTLPNYTLVRAMRSGYLVQIPLNDTMGFNYTYDKNFASNEQIIKEIEALFSLDLEHSNIEWKDLPHLQMQKHWVGNCLALGSGVFNIEALVAGPLSILQQFLETFMTHFPRQNLDPYLNKTYHEKIRNICDEVADLTRLHYILCPRDDSPFWQACKKNPPENDKTKELCMKWKKCHGQLSRNIFQPNSIFSENTYQLIFNAFQYLPESAPPLARYNQSYEKAQILEEEEKILHKAAEGLPRHRDYLNALSPPLP